MKCTVSEPVDHRHKAHISYIGAAQASSSELQKKLPIPLTDNQSHYSIYYQDLSRYWRLNPTFDAESHY